MSSQGNNHQYRNATPLCRDTSVVKNPCAPEIEKNWNKRAIYGNMLLFH
jgi:hypothetical protein